MMYNNKLVVCVKNNGKVLREINDTVLLPFGSEYSILLKNLNSVRAVASISIDGQDVGDGKQFIIKPNDSIEIERFVKNLNEGNRFKFVERTSAVERHRGIGADDGLIRVEFKFEKITPQYIFPPYCSSQKYDIPNGGIVYTVNTNVQSAFNTKSIQTSYDTGVTVPGSISNQQFEEGDNFPTETETHVIVLQLKGQMDDKQVVRPVTVKTKPKCVTCGRTNKATAKFCTECGTALTIL